MQHSLGKVGSLYGYEIESELPLRRLNGAGGARGAIAVRVAENGLQDRSGTVTGYLESESGEPLFAGAEVADGHLLSYPASGSAFCVQHRSRTIAVAPGDSAEETEHRLACAAVCTMLALDGDLVLHACAVQASAGALVFCGPSGRGKSTLAHALGRRGCPVVSEDGAAIELSGTAPLAFPGPRGVRVRNRSDDGGVTLSLLADPGPGEPAPCEVAAIAQLDERGPRLAVEPLSAAHALALLTPNLVHTGSRPSLAQAFAGLGLLLRAVPAFRVSLPEGLATLDAASPELLDRVQAGL